MISGNGYLIALICTILVVCAMCVGTFLYWHLVLRRRHGTSRDPLGVTSSATCHRHHDDEKSNNLQNEENLRRYANPLKDDVSSSMSSIAGISPGSLCKPGTAESLSDLQSIRVSIVRPLSTGAGESSSSEMLEMIPDAEKPCTSSMEPSGLRSAHRNSQVLLFKAQNPDVRKNTAAFEDVGHHKDFAKRIINLKVLPQVQRTLSPSQVDRGGDVLTVIV